MGSKSNPNPVNDRHKYINCNINPSIELFNSNSDSIESSIF